MQVILLQDLIHQGRRGEVIEVKAGFARNYLLPQGMALEATPGNLRYYQQLRKKIDAKHLAEVGAAREVASKLAGLQIRIAKRVGETGTLYGSVTASEIADELETRGFEIDKRRIDLEGGIKSLGDHPVRVDLHSEVIAEVVVTVVPEE